MITGYGDDTNATINFDVTQMPALPDISLNQSCMNGTNSKSPGKAHPTGGRTMKDYEDQLSALQKENFQLKLRVFFLEERMGIVGLGTSDEDNIKKNIELQIEIEALKKEIQEKQELLSQAARAFELHEEQKEEANRNQELYEQSLENERQRIEQLQRELDEYKEKMVDPSIYFNETLGITPESAIENKEKLLQMEELVESLEADVKQLTASLEEERSWGQELETERDDLRIRVEEEIRSREKLAADKDQDIESLREKIKGLEEEAFKRESVAQQYKTELAEKERVIKEKILMLEEKSRACEELAAIAEKRKKQVDQLRASVKSRDDALVDSNNKYRTLLNQFENNRRLSPPGSPSTLEDLHSFRSSYRSSQILSPTRSCISPYDWDSAKERIKSPLSLSLSKSPSQSTVIDREIKDLKKQLEERDQELSKQEDAKKQLVLKLCNVQQSNEQTEKELQKLKTDHEKALTMIREFINRQHRLEERQKHKEHKIAELQHELKKSSESSRTKKSGHVTVRKDLEYDLPDDSDSQSHQQRFEDMETKINDLRYEISSIKAEKSELEQQIHHESEELRQELGVKQQQIEVLMTERDQLATLLKEQQEKIAELQSESSALGQLEEIHSKNLEIDSLNRELSVKNAEIEEQNIKIEALARDLQVKTHNLQQLVNTELWSKNKEIAKLHNLTANSRQKLSLSPSSSSVTQDPGSQLDVLVKELNDLGIAVKFDNDSVQINYINNSNNNNDQSTDIKVLKEYVTTLIKQKSDLEKEVDSLTWFKLLSKPETSDTSLQIESRNAREYCELLRTHLKGLVKFMKEILKSTDYNEDDEHKKIIIDFLASSKILSEDLVHALEDVPLTLNDLCICQEGQELIKSQTEMIVEEIKHQGIHESAQSDSETFSEPDRIVSLARIGLQDVYPKVRGRLGHGKFSKSFSDSEDSLDYIPCHKTYQMDVNEAGSGNPVQVLQDTNNILRAELNDLRNELAKRADSAEDKLLPIISRLESSQSYCEKLYGLFEERERKNGQDGNYGKKDKRKMQMMMEKKMLDMESMAVEIAKQKNDLMQYQEVNEKKINEMILTLNVENDALRAKLKKLEEENETARGSVGALTQDLDRLTLAHSQVLVENTKLTNDKLRLEQEMRKMETRYDASLRGLQEKFEKEIAELSCMNETHRQRMQDLEAANKELRRRLVVENSDSAPSSSGVSSVPEAKSDDILQEFHSYSSHYWLPISYPSSGRSKSSCSPDLGIESDAAVSIRPLKDTLKITESMSNLLSDEEVNCNNRTLRDLDRESPLHTEGGLNYSLDEVEALKQENEALKKRLMKTRRALEDTFEHLSASNKNKKNVEKAITKQLMITKSILKKTRTYEEPFEK
ncbi:centrosomin isoform X3 [Microplitis demolitor]|uniref:centrosomin isoform X3 n=1 Tax=Microplitis demolitor TaxID=69319 RepID=UPI0004CD58B1|nr:centrosomin isoform X3 [Microplitis demolitor]